MNNSYNKKKNNTICHVFGIYKFLYYRLTSGGYGENVLLGFGHFKASWKSFQDFLFLFCLQLIKSSTHKNEHKISHEKTQIKELVTSSIQQ